MNEPIRVVRSAIGELVLNLHVHGQVDVTYEGRPLLGDPILADIIPLSSADGHTSLWLADSTIRKVVQFQASYGH